MTDILEAMRENRVLEIEYHPFYLEESQHIQLLPYFVKKLYERRWYVYGPTQENRRISLCSGQGSATLDLGQTFRMPKVSRPRSIGDFYRHHAYPDIPPRRIVMENAESSRNTCGHCRCTIHRRRQNSMTDGHCSATTSLRPMNSTAKYLHPGNSWRSSRPKRFGRNMRPSSKRCSDSTANFEFFFINKSHCA